MNFFNKLFSFGKKKEIINEGGFEVLRKLTGSDISNKAMLEQYGKSLYVFACISKIAEKVASIEWKMYRIINSKGETKEIESHPALDLIYKVNPFQTKTEFLETTIINLKCAGDAFWYKVRNNSGKVVELWNLRPDFMTIVTDPEKFIKGYKFHKSTGETVDIATEDVVHFKYPDPLSQYLGMSPLKPAQRRIQTEDYATTFQRDFFLNSARPDAIIKNANETLSAEQKEDIREGWNRRYRGVGKTSSVAILEGGLDYQIVSVNQKEMDYINSMKFTRDDILVAFKVPKPIIAIVDDVNRANSETAMFIFLSETIKPEMVRIMEKANEELMIPDFGEEFYFDFEDPTPENRELRLKEYESGLMNNYLLINEVRQAEGKEPIKGGWSFYRPLTDQAYGGLSGQEAKIIDEEIINPSKKAKVFSFKGKYWLQKKLELKEGMEKAIVDVMTIDKNKKNITKSNAPKEKKLTSLIKGEELRKSYQEIQIKKLDNRTENLKSKVNGFADGQKERVLDKMGGEKEIKVTVEQIFNEGEELKLTIDFITPQIYQMLKDAGIEALELVEPQTDFKDTKRIQALIKKRAEEFAKEVNSTTLSKLDSALSEGIASGEGIDSLRKRVGEVYQEFPSYRSEMIARTEATASNNEGFLEGYKQSGVATGKEWIATLDERTRPEHAAMNGEIIELDKTFSNGLQYPSEPNCRCVIGPAFVE